MGLSCSLSFILHFYAMFGVFSSIALAFNLLLLVAVLSMLQQPDPVPGMAAMALALGMAIDANVLINERVREELRNGPRRRRPSTPATTGLGTILDSNVDPDCGRGPACV